MTRSPRALVAWIRADQLMRGSVNLAANNVSAAVLGFVGWVVTTHLFAVSSVGQAGATIAAASLAANLAQLGAPGTLLRFLPSAEDPQKLLQTALGVTLSCSVGLGLVVAALQPPPADGGALALMIAVVLLFVLALVAKAVTEAAVIAERASSVALSATVAANGLKIVALAALGGLAAGAWGIVVAQCVAASANVALLAVHLHRTGLLRGRPSLNRDAIRRVGGYATGQYANGIAGGLPLLVLPVLVKANLGDSAAGYWYVASLIATAMTLISAGVAQSLLVEAAHDPSVSAALARRALRALMFVTIPVVVGAFLLSPWFLGVFGSGYATESLTAFRILALSTVLSPTIYVLGTMFFVRRRLAPLLAVNLVNGTVVLGFASQAETLPGVAWAWLIGEVVYVVLFVTLLPLFPARVSDPEV